MSPSRNDGPIMRVSVLSLCWGVADCASCDLDECWIW
jgi:hypothetical protein